jgi:hypothetical protein
MYAHRIVGCNGAIEERPSRSAAVLLYELFEAVLALPEGKNVALEVWKIDSSHLISFAL